MLTAISAGGSRRDDGEACPAVVRRPALARMELRRTTMGAQGIRLLTTGLFLSYITFVAAQTPSTPAAGPFEVLPYFEASAILPGDLVQGPNHRVAPRVNNDGYYNLYRITSPVGTFDAISTRMRSEEHTSELQSLRHLV